MKDDIITEIGDALFGFQALPNPLHKPLAGFDVATDAADIGLDDTQGGIHKALLP